MWLSLAVIWICAGDGSWISGTEIFHPLASNEVLIRADGGAWILDFRGAHVDAYGPDGRRQKQIGGKGQGPGEFVYPSAIFRGKEGFFVFDKNNHSLSHFDATGEFVTRQALPERNLLLAKVIHGWALANWDGRGHVGPRQLYFLDERLENKRLLYETEAYGRGGGLYATQSEGKRTSEFGGISRRAKILAAKDGLSIFVSHPVRFEIVEIRIADGKALKTYVLDEAAIPFDEAWAEEELDHFLAGSKIPRNEVKRAYPSHFPAIRSMSLDPEGNLIVDRWRGKPSSNHYPVAFDLAGKLMKPNHEMGVLARLITVKNGQAYLTTYDPETEEGGLARVPTEEMRPFLAKNPIRYQGQVIRAISSSRVQ